MVKYSHEKQKAIEITVRLNGNVQQYAMSFLHIFNNARDNKDIFYKVGNISGSNDIFVTCNPEYVENVKEYLEQFGEIRYTEEVNWFVVSAQYDSAGWTELFGDDCESYFTVEMD